MESFNQGLICGVGSAKRGDQLTGWCKIREIVRSNPKATPLGFSIRHPPVSDPIYQVSLINKQPFWTQHPLMEKPFRKINVDHLQAKGGLQSGGGLDLLTPGGALTYGPNHFRGGGPRIGVRSVNKRKSVYHDYHDFQHRGKRMQGVIESRSPFFRGVFMVV